MRKNRANKEIRGMAGDLGNGGDFELWKLFAIFAQNSEGTFRREGPAKMKPRFATAESRRPGMGDSSGRGMAP